MSYRQSFYCMLIKFKLHFPHNFWSSPQFFLSLHLEKMKKMGRNMKK